METDSSYGQVVTLPWARRRREEPRAAPELPVAPTVLTDVHPLAPADPTATGFVLALLGGRSGAVLWAQDHASRRENGLPYTPGLRGAGLEQPLLQARVNTPRDVLRVLEEGATCAGLSAVVGEIHGIPAVLDFTATKRLALRAQASGVPVFLIRSGDPGTLSAARARWRAGALPSRPHPHDSGAPGQPQWDVEQFRAQGRSPGRWVARYDPGAASRADRLCLVSRPDAGALEAGDQRVPDRAGG